MIMKTTLISTNPITRYIALYNTFLNKIRTKVVLKVSRMEKAVTFGRELSYNVLPPP